MVLIDNEMLFLSYCVLKKNASESTYQLKLLIDFRIELYNSSEINLYM